MYTILAIVGVIILKSLLYTLVTVIDAYDVSLRATQNTLEAAQQEAAISKKELENEMEKKMAILQDNYEQQADQLEAQRKGIHEIHTILYYFCVIFLCN